MRAVWVSAFISWSTRGRGFVQPGERQPAGSRSEWEQRSSASGLSNRRRSTRGNAAVGSPLGLVRYVCCWRWRWALLNGVLQGSVEQPRSCGSFDSRVTPQQRPLAFDPTTCRPGTAASASRPTTTASERARRRHLAAPGSAPRGSDMMAGPSSIVLAPETVGAACLGSVSKGGSQA